MNVNLFLLQFMGKLISSLENELFVHYMFLDKAFMLPTSAGFPLKLSLSGVLAPGAKGGLTIDRMMVILLTSVNFVVSHLSSRLLMFFLLLFTATALIHAICGNRVCYPNGCLYPRICGSWH